MEQGLDYLPKINYQLRQRNDMFKINTDTVLLGQYMKVKKGEIVLDLGCNNGALLLYASVFEPKLLIGVDKIPEAIELAKENLQRYNLDAELICEDICNFRHEQVDVIVCNPPYFVTDDPSSKNTSEYLKIARHEESCTLDTLFSSARVLLKDKGRFYLVHRSSRIAEILLKLAHHQLKVKSMQFVYDHQKSSSITVLLEITKGVMNEIKVQEPLWLEK